MATFSVAPPVHYLFSAGRPALEVLMHPRSNRLACSAIALLAAVEFASGCHVVPAGSVSDLAPPRDDAGTGAGQGGAAGPVAAESDAGIDSSTTHGGDAGADAPPAAHPGGDASTSSDSGQTDAGETDAGADGQPSSPGHYVDPLHGSMANPGTAESPWSTLEEVFAAGKTFTAGEVIYLRRGYHGGPIIRGKNTAMVTITAEPGHAPLMKWVQFSGASYWTLKDVFINPEAAPADGRAALIDFVASSTNNLVRNVGAYSAQDPYGFRADEQAWLTHQKTGVTIQSGGNNHLDGVYFLNLGNGMIVSSSGNLIEHTTMENFTRDGWVPLADNNTWQYNLIENAIMTDHTVSIFAQPPAASRLHRDMVQTWNGARKGMVFRGNTMIAVADPELPLAGNDPTTTGYIDKRITVFAGWDGPFSDYTFENNVIFSDHQAGIWLNNATNCRIVNNTATTITLPTSYGFPAIKIIGKSSGNLVYNNIASSFELDPGSFAGAGSNLTAPLYAPTFLSQSQPSADVHLKATATAARGAADDAYAPSIDADGNPRPGKGNDIGAYTYGTWAADDTAPPTTPGAPVAITVPPLGVDLSWGASTDNREVKGYDIYRNGAKVGRTRNGSRFFDLGGALGASYTIVAFDLSGNRSSMGPVGVAN